MSGTRIDLGPVQETLLIPLYGRAVETRKETGLLDDPRAVEIVASLDYDFGKWKGKPSLRGACLRTRMFDKMVQRFLDAHPEGTFIEIGSGLNTRFERLDNGRVRWFDLDLPDVIALRRRFFEDTDRRRMIVASVLDDGWMEQVAESGGPFFFVSEAVIIYLDEAQVRQVFASIGRRFPGAQLCTDTCSTEMVESQDRHDVMKTMPRTSWFRWACDDPFVLQSWVRGMRLERSDTFVDADPAIIASLPLMYRLLVRFAPGLLRRRVDGYRLNQFRFA